MIIYCRRIVFKSKNEKQNNQNNNQNKDCKNEGDNQNCKCDNSNDKSNDKSQNNQNVEQNKSSKDNSSNKETSSQSKQNIEDISKESSSDSKSEDKDSNSSNNNDIDNLNEINKPDNNSEQEELNNLQELLNDLNLCRGGGEQVKITKSKIDHSFRNVMERLSSGLSFKIAKGTTFIDTEKFMSNLITKNYDELKYSTFDYTPKQIFFFVDTSGSVSQFANIFIEMINSCVNSKHIQVISGSEAQAERDEKLKEYIIFEHKSKQNNMCRFGEKLHNFIIKYKVPLNSTFVFWGDGIYADIDSSLKSILMNYKAIWLSPHNKEHSLRYDLQYVSKMIPVYYNMNNINSITNQLKRLI